MGFVSKGFETPIYTEQSKEPERVIIISCEGSNTEPEYFETIKEKLSEYIPVILEIKIVPKPSNASEPQNVVSNLENYIIQYDYKSDYDEMWVVWDREKVPERKENILKMFPKCREKNYNIAITNPLFEFWLLLHVTDISEYDNEDLYNNMPVNSRRKFLDKELSNILENGYNKKKDKFNKDIVTKDNILKALEQEKLFENEFESILDNLGSNIGELINKILKI